MAFKSNAIVECSYCGERIPSGKYCSRCRTQEGRKKAFDENVEIAKENKKAGYNTPESFRNWK